MLGIVAVKVVGGAMRLQSTRTKRLVALRMGRLMIVWFPSARRYRITRRQRYLKQTKLMFLLLEYIDIKREKESERGTDKGTRNKWNPSHSINEDPRKCVAELDLHFCVSRLRRSTSLLLYSIRFRLIRSLQTWPNKAEPYQNKTKPKDPSPNGNESAADTLQPGGSRMSINNSYPPIQEWQTTAMPDREKSSGKSNQFPPKTKTKQNKTKIASGRA